jgi:hypothetical protein
MLSGADAAITDTGDVTDVELVGRVLSVRDGIAFLAYRGRIAGTHRYTRFEVGRDGEQLAGKTELVSALGNYDIAAGQMRSITWVGDGYLRSLHPPAPWSPWGRFGIVAQWRLDAGKAVAQSESKSPTPHTKAELADSTPDDALKTFLIALARQDEAVLRAVALPHAEFDLLLKGPAASPEQVAVLRARLDEKPIKWLKVGDTVKMPNGESRVIKPADVREGRVVLWPEGAPLPSRLENVGGHWKVFAGTFIAARR